MKHSTIELTTELVDELVFDRPKNLPSLSHLSFDRTDIRENRYFMSYESMAELAACGFSVMLANEKYNEDFLIIIPPAQ